MRTYSAVSNLDLVRSVEDFLTCRGWRSEIFRYKGKNGIAKANLIARPSISGDKDAIHLAFICHTDTVPAAENRSSAFGLTLRDGYLHGSGACDMKGSLACFLAALPERVTANVALMLTADEEIGCKGMDRLLALTDLRIGMAIVSEPTSLRAVIAGKSYGLARVTVEGREAHSAFPQQGVSAISVAVRLIAAIEDFFGAGQCSCLEQQLFDPPHTTLNIG